MRIDPAERIAGVPTVAVRDFLRAHADFGFSVERLMSRLGLGRDDAEALIQALVDDGRIEAKDDGNETVWDTTIAGNALAMASAARPVRREVAEGHLAALLERVEEVNADPELLHWVTEVRVFGSMLDPERARLNDVDVAIAYVPRLPPEEFEQARFAYAERQQKAGRRAANFTAYCAWAEVDLCKRLKARSRVLSLHFGDRIIDRTASEVVSAFEPPPGAT